MALIPSNVKHRKTQRGRLRGTAFRGSKVSFGQYGLQALEGGWITAEQIEAARVVARHYTGELGQLIIRVFPHRNFTTRPAETRMGKGKGQPAKWIVDVQPGTMLFELKGVGEAMAREAFRRQAHKLPVRTRFVDRKSHEDFGN